MIGSAARRSVRGGSTRSCGRASSRAAHLPVDLRPAGGRRDVVPAIAHRARRAGSGDSHQRLLSQVHLTQIHTLSTAVQQLAQHADEVLRSSREAPDRLTSMPWCQRHDRAVLVAEIGVDMGPVPHAGASGLLARALPADGRERRQAPVDSDPAPDAVAGDGAGPGRVGGDPQSRQLSAAGTSAPAGTLVWTLRHARTHGHARSPVGCRRTVFRCPA